MGDRKDGGPAFPQGDLSAYGIGPGDGMDGMSLRDWFAGMAMMGIAANSNDRVLDKAFIARAAYRMADAMLAERNKQP